MKGRQIERLARKHLLPVLPKFAVRGSLVYRQPVGDLLYALSFETSSFTSSRIFVEAFVQPLFVPADCLWFTFGDRLGGTPPRRVVGRGRGESGSSVRCDRRGRAAGRAPVLQPAGWIGRLLRSDPAVGKRRAQEAEVPPVDGRPGGARGARVCRAAARTQGRGASAAERRRRLRTRRRRVRQRRAARQPAAHARPRATPRAGGGAGAARGVARTDDPQPEDRSADVDWTSGDCAISTRRVGVAGSGVRNVCAVAPYRADAEAASRAHSSYSASRPAITSLVTTVVIGLLSGFMCPPLCAHFSWIGGNDRSALCVAATGVSRRR